MQSPSLLVIPLRNSFTSFKTDAQNCDTEYFASASQTVFNNEVKNASKNIERLEKFSKKAKLSNSTVLQALGESISRIIHGSVLLCRQYEELLLREGYKNMNTLHFLFHLETGMKPVNFILDVLKMYKTQYGTLPALGVSQSAYVLNFLFEQLSIFYTARGVNDSFYEILSTMFSDCMRPVSQVVQSLLRRELQTDNPYILHGSDGRYRLSSVKVFESIHPRFETLLEEYHMLLSSSKPCLLHPDKESLHQLVLRAMRDNDTSLYLSLTWKLADAVQRWSNTALDSFQLHNTHEFLMECELIKKLNLVHYIIFEEPFSKATRASQLVRVNSIQDGYFLGGFSQLLPSFLRTMNFSLYRKLWRFTRILKSSCCILTKARKSMQSVLEMRISFEMQHLLNVLVDCAQEGYLEWVSKTREKLLQSTSLKQLQLLLDEHILACSACLFCQESESHLYDALLFSLQQIIAFGKYSKLLSVAEYKTFDAQSQLMEMFHNYRQSCRSLYTLLCFMKVQTNIEPHAYENICRLLLKYNFNEFYQDEYVNRSHDNFIEPVTK